MPDAIQASPSGPPIGRPRTAVCPCPEDGPGVLPTRASPFQTTDRKLPDLREDGHGQVMWVSRDTASDRPTIGGYHGQQRNAREGAVLGLDVGKASHWACMLTRDGEAAVNRPVANSEHKLDRLFSQVREGTPVVVDQVRNIGALPISRARRAGLGVAYLPGIAVHQYETIVWIGAVHREWLTDNMSALVCHRVGRAQDACRALFSFARDAGFELKLCRVMSPQMKGRSSSRTGSCRD